MLFAGPAVQDLMQDKNEPEYFSCKIGMRRSVREWLGFGEEFVFRECFGKGTKGLQRLLLSDIVADDGVLRMEKKVIFIFDSFAFLVLNQFNPPNLT